MGRILDVMVSSKDLCLLCVSINREFSNRYWKKSGVLRPTTSARIKKECTI